MFPLNITINYAIIFNVLFISFYLKRNDKFIEIDCINWKKIIIHNYARKVLIYNLSVRTITNIDKISIYNII